MKSINKKALRIFSKLVEGIDKPGDHKRVDNCDSAFMPVVIECVGIPDFGDAMRPGVRLISIAHYYEQSGDLIQDPEIVFLVTPDAAFPMDFFQPPFRDRAAKIEDGKLMVNAKRQRDLASFAGQWLSNIKSQQNL